MCSLHLQHSFLRPFASLSLLLAMGLPLSSQTPGSVASELKISNLVGGFEGAIESLGGFGNAACPVGDLDGNGVVDLAVGEPFSDTGGTNRGSIWILFRDNQGEVLSELEIGDGTGGFNGSLEDFDAFGRRLANIGDIDGDGIDELAVGMEADDAGGNSRGSIWILFLDSTGKVRSQVKITEGQGGFTGALVDFSFFGSGVAGLGDLNHDGTPDLAVGANGDDDGGSSRGAVWILFLNPDGTVASHQKISQTSGGFGGALEDIDLFGSSVTCLRDMDGDGVVELAVGARADDDGAQGFFGATGAAWVLFLNRDGTVHAEQKISMEAGNFTGILNDDDQFGIDMTSLGDLDGDGLEELVVGTFGDDDGGVNRGGFWVLFLNADGTVRFQQKVSQITGGFGGILSLQDRFGISVASIGDTDGDGIQELVVGATGDDDGGLDMGAIWILDFNGVSFPASATVRNGSGTNPLSLSSDTLPVIGSPWTASVDTSTYTGATLTLLVGVDAPLFGSATGFGELLIDPLALVQVTSTAGISAASSTHTLDVPSDISLVGLPIFLQAAILGAGPELTSALDIVLGN